MARNDDRGSADAYSHHDTFLSGGGPPALLVRAKDTRQAPAVAWVRLATLVLPAPASSIWAPIQGPLEPLIESFRQTAPLTVLLLSGREQLGHNLLIHLEGY